MEIKKMSYDEMISQLDGACGRLIVASMSNNEVKEAHEMVMEVSIALGEMAYDAGCEEVNICKWKQANEDFTDYESECDNLFTFFDGGPKDNHFIYCPYCGKKIAEVRFEDRD